MFLTPQPLTTDNTIGNGRVAIIFEYDGQAFHGWQFQKSGVRSVEGELSRAAARVADHPVDLVCAGRTDAGVHASFQVAHFDTPSVRNLRSWVMGMNTALPDDISVHWAGNGVADFHARFSATYRRYRYVIYNHPVRPGIQRGQVSWTFRPLDADRMHRAAQALVGEHDFSSFRAAGCQSRTPVRFLERISVTRCGDYVVIDVQANAFLHHMVRNIAGALMAVGNGQQPPEWISGILEARDRTCAGVTAPPYGLYLVDVGYPEHLGIPEALCGPAFVAPWFDRKCNEPIAPTHIHPKQVRAES
ncbi:tRNA pseudouridine(38-40) synthase TruA [Marinobacter daepoensis]|uniref:tRNA pseudouridine synthase A n=1 Tax=Marinobacter daepoensis TaxID=262077 RepID=A0ABS3BAQ5_9GAMM|nr:tRNA pseudouridine(38-40) synthase TruA [Marinobacter daepoensis]MBN7768948.1 tRNA pseudouridine(38-40) synthase TruA [Marinobacter daepoensis]MBY6032447.1 tRNA pseudouridine(38-40) synthase TruA [Marinobacter daepoensis]MBY6077638.1 tRNA pseudouridine(38-40) synthase TruA [Marinobacter daepoensis]